MNHKNIMTLILNLDLYFYVVFFLGGGDRLKQKKVPKGDRWQSVKSKLG